MTFSVLICSTRSFKDVFPSSELKKKKDQKFFLFFLSFSFSFLSFFFPSKNSDMYSRVRVLYGFFFFSFAQFTRVRFLRRSISHIFFFFFFSFPHNFRNVFSFRFDIHEANIYIFERETTSLGLDMRRNYTFRFL